MAVISPNEMPRASLVLAPLTDLRLGADSAIAHPVAASPAARTFDDLYHAYAQFVWRSAFRLGVPRSAVEDVMQDVFLVVHRRLADYEERTSMKAWISAIVIRVVRAHRRKSMRRDVPDARDAVDPETIADAKSKTPFESFERDETVRELYAILERMNDERREVFVLSELEELTAPEIALALQVNVNTIYWRLRTARKEFEQFFRRRTMEGRPR
jgi:RNA polymerase sigma-70 factor, ECF subfamily